MISEATERRVAHELAEDLRPALVRLARELRRETEQLGVTSRQASLLWLVRRRPGLSLRSLAEAEGISAPSLSGHLDRLEALELVVRVRSSGDRRRVGVELTDDGERLLRRIRARRTTWLTDRLEELDDAALADVARAIPALRRLVGMDEA
jgi:DNA-binding MarR family transcriptional regulator